MKKKMMTKIVLGAMAVAFSSCTAKYIDINTNQNEPGSLNPDGYALLSAMNNVASSVVSSDVNTAQFTDCLLGGPLGGYFAESKTGWANTISKYDAKNDWTRVFLNSNQVIPVLYSNLTSIKAYSESSRNPVPWAMAQIIKVAAMSRITDTYGPIPYSKIGEDGNIVTPYDSQQDIYMKFFEELDASIQTLKENPNVQLVANVDKIYDGNLAKWVKFANSLKLRLAIRMAYADKGKAGEIAMAAVQDGVMESNADNAAWNNFTSITNPLFTAVRYNENATGGDTHVAADIVCYMNGYKDPRREVYFEKSTWNRGEDYVGLRRGIDQADPVISPNYAKYSKVKISATDPIQWMNAAEVAFLRAEGTEIFGFNLGDSRTYYEKGIQLSFEQWGVQGWESYKEDGRSTPSEYTDPSGKATYNQRLSDITIKWNDADTPEKKQERIITQKWIANWMLGNEAWADYRRTGYPKLMPAFVNNSGGTVDNVKGARRMPYPQEEYTNNGENVQYAVKSLLKDADDMGSDVWWACKPGI